MSTTKVSVSVGKTKKVTVKNAKKVVVTAELAKTTKKPTNGSTNEPVKEPTATNGILRQLAITGARQAARQI